MRATVVFRENAARCRADANEATLDNVRDRNLRAEAAWLVMAERQERIDTARAEREGTAAAAHTPDMETI